MFIFFGMDITAKQKLSERITSKSFFNPTSMQTLLLQLSFNCFVGIYIYILRLEDSLRCSSLSYSPCFVTQGHSLKHAAFPLCLARWSASPRDFSITVSQDREITNAYPKIVSFYMCSGDQNQYHVIVQQTFNQLSYRLSPQPLI